MATVNLQSPLKWRVNRSKELYEVQGKGDTEWMSLGVSKTELEEVKEDIKKPFKGAKVRVEAYNDRVVVTDNRQDVDKLYTLSEIKKKDFLFDGSFTIMSNPGYVIGNIKFMGLEPNHGDWVDLSSYVVNLHNYSNDFSSRDFEGNNTQKGSIFSRHTKKELFGITSSYSYYGNLSEEIDSIYTEYKFVVYGYPIFLGKPSFYQLRYDYDNPMVQGSSNLYFNNNEQQTEKIRSYGWESGEELNNEILEQGTNVYYHNSLDSDVITYKETPTVVRCVGDVIDNTQMSSDFEVVGVRFNNQPHKNDYKPIYGAEMVYTEEFSADMNLISKVNSTIILCVDQTTTIKPHLIVLNKKLIDLYETNREDYFNELKKYVLSGYNYSTNDEKMSSSFNDRWSFNPSELTITTGENKERPSVVFNSYNFSVTENSRYAILYVEEVLGEKPYFLQGQSSEETQPSVQFDNVDREKMFTFKGNNVYVTKPLEVSGYTASTLYLNIIYGTETEARPSGGEQEL